MALQWDSPPPDEQNGIIRFYEIYMAENETGLTQQFRTVGNTFLIDTLHPDYYYTISVRAVTIKPGELSNPIFVTSLEDSKY